MSARRPRWAVTTAPGYLPSDVDAESYLFANDIIHQPDAGNVAGFPTQWINASNAVVSYPQTGQAKYGMTQSVVTKYQSEIANDLKSLPAISLAMNPDDLFGAGSTGTNGIKGIYSNSLTSDNGTRDLGTGDVCGDDFPGRDERVSDQRGRADAGGRQPRSEQYTQTLATAGFQGSVWRVTVEL